MLRVSACGYAWFADTFRLRRGDRAEQDPLRFAHFGSFQDYQFWSDVLSEFADENQNLPVRQEYVVGLGDQYHAKLRQQILSGTLPDVALIQLGPFREIAESFADLTVWANSGDPDRPPLSTLLNSTGLSAFPVRCRLRALPVSGRTLVIYCTG